MKLAKRVLVVVVLTLVAVAVILNLLQDKFIFRSTVLDKDFKFEFEQPFEEHFISTPDGDVINCLWFTPADSSRGLVIYFHGNASNLSRWGRNAVDFTSLGYDVVMMDYRGYGKSSGTPSEQILYKDADQLCQWAKAKSKYNRLIIYGRSLGTAVASHLAMTAKPDLLILETPFDDLKGAAPAAIQPILSVFPLSSVFPNIEHLRQVSCRKVIFHGTNDRVVPLSSALKLKPLLGEGDEFIVIPEGTHRNLRTFDLYKSKIAQLLK